jgi:YVTN family beta-propeller protein
MRTRFAAVGLAAALASFTSPAVHADTAGQVRIVQTNSGDDSIHLIDPSTNTIVGEIHGVPINHGAAAAPDGSRLYFSSEAEKVLAVVDPKTNQVTHKIALSGRPNNITISADGRTVYVAIVSDPGAVDVIDTMKLERVNSIRTQGGIHNVYLTRDGKYLIAGSIAGRKMIVIDAKTQMPIWSVFNEGVRPIAIESNPNGSAKRLFVQLSEVHGFAVVDFQERQEVARIRLPEIPENQRDKGPFNGSPSHGIGITPDGKWLWVASRPNGMVYEYSLPDLKLVGSVAVGKRPDWLTFTPDGKRLYVATESTNSVTVVDVPSRSVVTKIRVGPSPKRNITAVLR